MSNVIKFFHSRMEGAPVLSDSWLQMTTLLDACLVDGFNSKTITSITRTGTTVTATIAAGHKYIVPQIVLITGANEPEYNGEQRLTNVTSTTFTFEIVGTPATPATGTITVKTAPLGFARPFTGTGKRAYQSTNPSSNKPILRVEDFLPLNAAGTNDYSTAYCKHARVGICESMSDINTPVGAQAPYDPGTHLRNWITTGTGASVISGWYKWYWTRYPIANTGSEQTSETSIKNWTIIGDDRGFYLFISTWGTGNSWGYTGYCFQDFESYRVGDKSNTLLCAADWINQAATLSNTGSGGNFPYSLDFSGKICLRDYTQVGSPARLGFSALNTINAQHVMGHSTNTITYPNASNMSLLLHPIFLKQETGHMRGKLPGILWPINNTPNIADLEIISGVTGYAGKSFMCLVLSAGGAAASRTFIDITGPWR